VPLVLVDERAGYVCGQTQQLSLFVLGALIMPGTGFAPGEITQLGQQPTGSLYTASGMTLNIPKLDTSLEIVGVAQTPVGWDVSWLGRQAGYLNGTAYPTQAGNTVITGHVWGADNQPGPFYSLDELQHGDQFSIVANGRTYIYEVRDTQLLPPSSVRPFAHSDYDMVTLVTCEVFDPVSGEYQYRRAVSAVLVEIQ
jgi:LPXTG-site transpeptidase (sortase) family protein